MGKKRIKEMVLKGGGIFNISYTDYAYVLSLQFRKELTDFRLQALVPTF